MHADASRHRNRTITVHKIVRSVPTLAESRHWDGTICCCYLASYFVGTMNEPQAAGEPNPGEPEPQQQHTQQHEELLFVNHETLERGLHRHAAALFAKERQRVLDQLPAAYRENFGAVGFCRKRPVQIVSPYQVPLGPLRTEWMDAFCKVSTAKSSKFSFCFARIRNSS